MVMHFFFIQFYSRCDGILFIPVYLISILIDIHEMHVLAWHMKNWCRQIGYKFIMWSIQDLILWDVIFIQDQK